MITQTRQIKSEGRTIDVNRNFTNTFRFALAIVVLSCLPAQSHTYVLCEGNYAQGNATLWHIDENNEIHGLDGNPVGDTGQSLTVHEDRLFAVMNGSSMIRVYDISPETGSLTHVIDVNMNFSGPREMVVFQGRGFITQWYTSSVAVLDLETFQVTNEIPVIGLPEDIISDGIRLYASITMNSSDWSSSNWVAAIDPVTETVLEYHDVGFGPGQMLLVDQQLYIARTWYDPDWNAYAGTSRLDLATGEILISDYGVTSAYGADLIQRDGTVYRTFSSSIAPLDDMLQIMEEESIGNIPGLYSVSATDAFIIAGFSDDYLAPDYISMLDWSGTVLQTLETGAIPGSFAFWPEGDDDPCNLDGDINGDESLDILDLILMINHVLELLPLTEDQLCAADYNEDGVVDILDIVGWIAIILEA